jgi:hypothetical protein
VKNHNRTLGRPHAAGGTLTSTLARRVAGAHVELLRGVGHRQSIRFPSYLYPVQAVMDPQQLLGTCNQEHGFTFTQVHNILDYKATSRLVRQYTGPSLG